MVKTRLTVGFSALFLVHSAMAGEAVFYVTEDGAAVTDVTVKAGTQKKLVGKAGYAVFELEDGSYTVEYSQLGEAAGETTLTLENGEDAEVHVDLVDGDATSTITKFASDAQDTTALGQLAGSVTSADTAEPISGAVIVVSGTEFSVTTDEAGAFALELPRGQYALSVAHPNFGNRTVSDVRIIANVAAQLNLSLSVSGNGVIEEVVAIGTYVPSTVTALQRDSGAVMSAIGAEEIARFGDSTAASALKRVSGVTIADGKFAVVRGLNERHSSVTLNGASLPSTDPTRRVIPLDIFPSNILDGIDIQKSASADVPADSTGSAIKLKTISFPDEFEAKYSASIGYVSDLTFEDRQVQESESGDFFGFGAGGDREQPGALSAFESIRTPTSAQRSAAAASIPTDNLAPTEETIRPNISLEGSVGDVLSENTDGNVLGYNVAVKFKNEWSRKDTEANNYLVTSQGLARDDDLDEVRTVNDIDFSIGGVLGAVVGNHEYNSTTLLLRQTTSETLLVTGNGGDQDRDVLQTSHGWFERQFVMQQFSGEHFFESWLDSTAEWRVSLSQANYDAPDQRFYSFEGNEGAPLSEYDLFISTADRVYTESEDTNIDLGVDLSSMLYSGDNVAVKAKYGFSTFSRERDSETNRFGYRYAGSSGINPAFTGVTDINQIINPPNIANGTIDLVTETAAADYYEGTWDLTALYVAAEAEITEQWTVIAGARQEDSEIELLTYQTGASLVDRGPATEERAHIDEDDVFGSLNVTFRPTDAIQLRAAFYQTKNRPDFRELSNASFFDPVQQKTFKGNPDLVSAEIDNVDLRAEWYLSDEESVSVAYFTKDFDNPIEQTFLGGGEIRTFDNARSGTLDGFEIDFRKAFDVDAYSAFVSGNVSVIDSEAKGLDVAGTTRTTTMQGTPENLFNLQLGLDDFDGGREYTLLLNYQGETLDAISPFPNEPDIIREPRAELSFNFKQDLSETMSLKLKLKNILNDEVELTQGGQIYEKYEKGTTIEVGVSGRF